MTDTRKWIKMTDRTPTEGEMPVYGWDSNREDKTDRNVYMYWAWRDEEQWRKDLTHWMSGAEPQPPQDAE